ncbi:MAG: hypothetical protein V1824_04005, partial [archaeon]
NYKNYDSSRINDFEEFCKYHKYVWCIAKSIGKNIELDLYIETEDKYLEFLNEIRYKFSDIIKSYETLNYYKEYKYNLFPR